MRRYYNHEDDWARQVPYTRSPDLPYDDFGWEPHESGLPEFRDPSDRFMPWERARVERWRDLERTPSGDYGVRGIWDRPGPYSGIGPKGYRRSDDRIWDDVCERMTENGLLDASQVQVEVKDGDVRLSGQVRSRREKRLAEDITESVSGVREIHNELRLSGDASRGGVYRNPAGVGRREDVGGSGVYPASGPLPDKNAEAQGMASWGQGERGAAGYQDHGDSELRIGRSDRD